MNISTTFSLGLGIAFALSLTIIWYLNKSLTQILIDLCGTEGRARFWVHVTNSSLLLTTMFIALGYEPEGGLTPLFQISQQLSKTLFGLLFTILVLSLIITRFIRRVDKQAELKETAAS